jgi:hypothetical protein
MAKLKEFMAENAAHKTAMDAAADTAAAVTEETRYQGVVSEILSSLMANHTALAADKAKYTCTIAVHSGS